MIYILTIKTVKHILNTILYSNQFDLKILKETYKRKGKHKKELEGDDTKMRKWFVL
jgi:hypothetical protein